MTTIDFTTRQLSAVVAASAVRPSPHTRLLAPGPGEPPSLPRLRSELAGDDAQQAEQAARELLELLEPESLAAAHALAFSGAGPVAARATLRAAWDVFRHDRDRGAN